MSLERLRDRILVYVILLIVFAGTLFKAFRAPTEWAQSHWLVTYDVGFIKRALPGTVLDLLNLYSSPEAAESTIWVVSLLWLGILTLALLFVIWRILQVAQWKIPFVLYAILFVTSSFVVISSSIIGYFDHIFHAGTILAIWLILRRQLLIAIMLTTVLVLVHESVMIIGYPVLLLAYTLTHKTPSKIELLMLSIPIGMTLFLIGYHESVDQVTLHNNVTSHLENFPFVNVKGFVELPVSDPVKYAIPAAYTSGFSSYFQGQLSYFPQRILSPEMSLRVYPFLGFSLLLLIYGFLPKLTQRNLSLCLLVIIFPLSLHLIAWDTERIWMYTVLNAFLVIWILSETYETSPIPVAHASISFFFILLIQLYGKTPLLQDQEEREDLLMIVLRPLLLVIVLYGLIFVKPIKHYVFTQAFAVSTRGESPDTSV